MARAADTFRWRGATSTAYNTPGNWIKTDDTTWATHWPGWDGTLSVIVDGDTVLLDGDPTNLLAGFDASALGDLLKLQIGQLYNEVLASSGAYLIFDMVVTTGQVIIDAPLAGNIFIKGAGTNKIPTLISLDLKSTSTLSIDGTVGTCNLLKGIVNVESTTTISTALNVSLVSSRLSDVTHTIEAGVTLPASINAIGGTITNSNAVTTLYLAGAKWTQAVGNITTAEITAGTLVWNAGNITTCNLRSGLLDGSNATVARTCTTLNQYKDGAVNLNDGAKRITVTTWNIYAAKPAIELTPGTVLTI